MSVTHLSSDVGIVCVMTHCCFKSAVTKHAQYMVCPKSNASDFFAQPGTARKGKWEYWQVEGEPTYTVGPSSVELAPLLQSVR